MIEYSKHKRATSVIKPYLPVCGTHDAFPGTRVPINSLPSLSTHQHVSSRTPNTRHCISSNDPSSLQRGLKRPFIAWLVYPKALRSSFRQGDRFAKYEMENYLLNIVLEK